MKTAFILLAALTGASLLMAATPQPPSGSAARAGGMFPFAYRVEDLDNGLRLIAVPLPYPDLVSFYAVVRAGSREEVEPGKTGFAHFFEHMMFRGTEKYPPEKYNEIMKVIGADHNAFTSDDLTAYHALFDKRDLEKVMELEADRFQNLKYPEEAFRTEAKAVLGEYNKNSQNPITKIFEAMRETSFQVHTYKHTTMGFIKDIEAMPNQFEYSKLFFDRFYRPENVVLIVAGDIDPANALALARKHWGGWRRGSYSARIPAEPEPRGPYAAKVDWPTPTLPWVVLGFRGPAYSDVKPEMAALDLAASVAFSDSSPLYRRLVIDEQKVDTLFSLFRDSRDPSLLYVGARLKRVEDMEYVKGRILETVEEMRTRAVTRERLDAVRSNLKYAFSLSMDNTASVASALAQYVHLEPTPETINRLFAMYDRLKPEDLMRACTDYLTERRMTVGVLATVGTLPGPADAPKAAPVVAADRPAPTEGETRALLKPAPIPLVSFRLLFDVGSASDPAGKEGLAALTAALLSNGGSRTMPYEKIVEALYPMAAHVGAQVDKEMTVFTGTTHVDNLDAYYGILSGMLLEPGWDAEDFKRVKDDALNDLKVNLRGNNDEELGKEALYISIYGPDHPYGHENTGSVAALESITLDDVKEFYERHYTQASLTVGLAGGYPEAFARRVRGDFARLPAGASSRLEVPQAPTVSGQKLTIIRKDTRATAISIGMPIAVTRADKDWAALWLAASYFGQHRSSNSYLYQRMRELRGLNYGDYAYVEYFPRGMFQLQPDPNLARRRQIFQIWIRPVEPANAHFALRLALYELRKLIEQGMTQRDFDQTRQFLNKYVAVMAKTPGAQLGYSLDGRYYGHGEFVPWARAQLDALTLEDVNRAIRANLSWENLKIVIVAKEAEALRDAIVGNARSPMAYNAPKAREILEEDEVVSKLELAIGASDVTILDVQDVFGR